MYRSVYGMLIASQVASLKLGQKCPHASVQSVLAQTEDEKEYVSDLFNLTDAVKRTKNLTIEGYKEVVDAVLEQYEATDAEVKDNSNPRGRFVACLLRVAGHDFMDFRHNETKTGGSDGCINLKEDDNRGI